MLKKMLKRIVSQKGMSGVLVTLLLVVVGVGLVAGVNTYMGTAQKKVTDGSDIAIDNAINAATGTTTP